MSETYFQAVGRAALHDMTLRSTLLQAPLALGLPALAFRFGGFAPLEDPTRAGVAYALTAIVVFVAARLATAPYVVWKAQQAEIAALKAEPAARAAPEAVTEPTGHDAAAKAELASALSRLGGMARDFRQGQDKASSLEIIELRRRALVLAESSGKDEPILRLSKAFVHNASTAVALRSRGDDANDALEAMHEAGKDLFRILHGAA